MMLRNGKFPGFGSASSGFTLFGAQNMFHPSMNMFDPQQSLLELTQSNPQNDLARNREDDLDSKSESENIEGLSGDEQTGSQRKRKKYHRHTQHQIQEMEGFFKECPHPDDKQRKELGRQLGLEPLQVKFWFQNKRTQMKTQQERHENQQLRTENEKLRIENMRMKEALSDASCPTCGGPTTVGEMSFDETQLRVENSRLREEIDRITTIAAKHAGKPMLQYPGMAPQSAPRSLDMSVGTLGMLHGMRGDVYAVSGNEDNRPPPVSVIGEAEKPLIVEIAVTGMEQLIRMIQLDDPLWVQDVGSGLQILNREEYTRLFPRSPRLHGLKPEASRDSAVIIMNPINLVELLMDVTEWSAMFSTIVSRATTLDVLSTGIAGNYDGALQVMTAEFQVATPLVPTRESFFARYCKRHQDGAWAVVDVSLDHLRHSPLFKCHRRPSGCLIEELPNGYSKVTWVEHVEVDDTTVHDIYRDLVNSTIAFGATRWVSTLDRKVQRIAAPLIDSMPPEDPGVLSNDNGRKSMLRLAQRMVTTFCGGVSASTAHTWTQLSGSGADDVRVMTRKSVDDPGRPPGIVLSAATSFWLPISPKRLFDFLRDPENRREWDVLSSGGEISDVAHIVNGRDPSNSACLLRVNATHPSQGNMLILQESLTDPSGSFVVYAPIDMLAMNMVLGGGNPDYVQLLPSGFAILPDGSKIMNGPESGEVETGGCLITVAFQILVDSTPNAKLSLGSVATVNNLIACTVEKVKVAVGIDT